MISTDIISPTTESKTIDYHANNKRYNKPDQQHNSNNSQIKTELKLRVGNA